MSKRNKAPALVPIGRTGVKRSGGYIDDEFHRDLRGRNGVKRYREILDNHAIVGGLYFLLSMLGRRTTYSTEESESERATRKEEAKRYIEEVLDDLKGGVGGFVANAMSVFAYGWVPFEPVFKIRRGRSPDPMFNSRFDDGRIGLRSVEIRAQESLDRWEYDDETGELLGMWQSAAPDYRLRFIPIDRLLMLRLMENKGSPEGRSPLRPAYPSYHREETLKFIEGVSFERDGAGMPVIEVPADIANATSGELLTIKNGYIKAVQNMKVDTQMGLLIAGSEDANGKTGYGARLMSSGGKSIGDLNTAIRRERQEVAMVFLGQFILVSMDNVGAQAAVKGHNDMFELAAGGAIDAALAVLNDELIPQLCVWAGFDEEDSPYIRRNELSKPDLAALGAFIGTAVGSGAVATDDELDNWAREQMGAPPRVETDPGRPGPTAGDVDRMVNQDALAGRQETPAQTEQQPAEQGTSESAPIIEPTEALNGAQITSLVGVLQSVASGGLPRESAIELITTAFPITPARAERLMGRIGRGFVINAETVTKALGITNQLKEPAQ